MRKWIFAAGLMLFSTPLWSETLTYRYDALGRLIQSFSDKSGFRTDYSFDAADNRSSISAANVAFALSTGQTLTSADGRFQLIMQGDSNLCLYQIQPQAVLWCTMTNGTGGSVARMQTDGNFVIYDAGGQFHWASNTSGHPASYLTLQNDGNLVIYDSGNIAIWNTGTGGH